MEATKAAGTVLSNSVLDASGMKDKNLNAQEQQPAVMVAGKLATNKHVTMVTLVQEMDAASNV